MKPDWKEKIANAPESFKARNPHLYDQLVAGRIRSEVAQPNLGGESKTFGMEAKPRCGRCRISFTVYRKQLLDEGDNAAMALKTTRDRIVEWLELPDDSPKYCDFEYHQIKSDTIHGTHVLVKRL